MTREKEMRNALSTITSFLFSYIFLQKRGDFVYRRVRRHALCRLASPPGRRAGKGIPVMDGTAVVIILVILYLLVKEKDPNGRKGR